MKTARNIIWAMIATMSAFWFAMEPQLFTSNNVFEWRSAMIQYSGILSLMLMSITMILAMRLPVVENWFNGMDKAYRVHKWIGIGGVALGVAHWLWYQIPKWMVMSGVLARPAHHNGSGPAGNLSGWEMWVNGLYERVKIDDAVTVEGPYGRLEFDLSKPQIWIAGGVGIASFFAVLEALKGDANHLRVDLFYCSRGVDDNLVDELWSLAHQAGVRLSVIDTMHSPRLNTERIASQCGDLNDYEFYFCGPEVFSKTLKKELGIYQFNIEQSYHEELFVMR